MTEPTITKRELDTVLDAALQEFGMANQEFRRCAPVVIKRIRMRIEHDARCGLLKSVPSCTCGAAEVTQ